MFVAINLRVLKRIFFSHLVISYKLYKTILSRLDLSIIDLSTNVQRDLHTETLSTTITDNQISLENSVPNGVKVNFDIARDNMAQSSIPKTPLGVPVFWESGANPTSEWSTWFGTLKMDIMARDNLVVDKLLKLKPTRAELFYPTLPTYEDAFEGETEDEERQREQRNEKRKVDWENECKQVEFRGPMIDRTPWDETDLKVKSLIYLSLGTEGAAHSTKETPTRESNAALQINSFMNSRPRKLVHEHPTKESDV